MTQKTLLEKYGLNETDKEKIDKSKDIIPTFNLGDLPVNHEEQFTIAIDEPFMVDFEQDGEQRREPVITVIDRFGMKFNIWLTAKSLKYEFFKLQESHESLKDLKVNLKVREYNHEKYGKTRGYSIQEIVTNGKEENITEEEIPTFE